jgi:hypothetical protein
MLLIVGTVVFASAVAVLVEMIWSYRLVGPEIREPRTK